MIVPTSAFGASAFASDVLGAAGSAADLSAFSKLANTGATASRNSAGVYFTSIVVVGRYIVPATGTTGEFVGNENKYADYDGEAFTYVAPVSGQTVLINTGPNAGQLWKFTTVWAKANISALVSYNWALTSAYVATNLVIYNGSWYQANANIPANTAFVVGTAGATWTAIGSTGAPIYGMARYTGADTNALTAGQQALFDAGAISTVTYSNSGRFTLAAGSTYWIDAQLSVYSTSSAVAATFQLWDYTNNVAIPDFIVVPTAVTSGSANWSSAPTMAGAYAPTQSIQVGIRVRTPRQCRYHR